MLHTLASACHARGGLSGILYDPVDGYSFRCVHRRRVFFLAFLAVCVALLLLR